MDINKNTDVSVEESSHTATVTQTDGFKLTNTKKKTMNIDAMLRGSFDNDYNNDASAASNNRMTFMQKTFRHSRGMSIKSVNMKSNENTDIRIKEH